MFDLLAQHEINLLTVVVLVLFTILAGFVIVKIDLNKLLEMRHKRQKERCRLLCPHVELVEEADGYEVHTTFFSPSGTTAFQCQKCGAITYDQAAIMRDLDYWATHPETYVKRLKKISKAMRHL